MNRLAGKRRLAAPLLEGVRGWVGLQATYHWESVYYSDSLYANAKLFADNSTAVASLR